MSTQRAGAYLRELREARGLSLATVGRRLQTSKSQVDRIERGAGETRTSLMLRYARLVGANTSKLAALLLGEPYDDDTWNDFDRLTPEQQRAVTEIIRQMIRDE